MPVTSQLGPRPGHCLLHSRYSKAVKRGRGMGHGLGFAVTDPEGGVGYGAVRIGVHGHDENGAEAEAFSLRNGLASFRWRCEVGPVGDKSSR